MTVKEVVAKIMKMDKEIDPSAETISTKKAVQMVAEATGFNSVGDFLIFVLANHEKFLSLISKEVEESFYKELDG